MPQKPVCGASLCTTPGVLNMQGLQAVVDPGQEKRRHSREFGRAPQGLLGGPPTNNVVLRWLGFLQASVLAVSCSTGLGQLVVSRGPRAGCTTGGAHAGASLAACVRPRVGVDSLKGGETFLRNVGVLASGDSRKAWPASC